MNCTLMERDGYRLLVTDGDGPPIGSARDATDLIGEAWHQQASVIVVAATRLDPNFFRLRTGLAGEFLQKIANYRAKLAVVGDISAQVAESDSLRDFVRESNRGQTIFFVPDLARLIEKLRRAHRMPH
jgi:hypothetical protein